MKEIMLCGRPGGCCPKVRIDDDTVSIEDDYGHKVTMSIEQFEILKEKTINIRR